MKTFKNKFLETLDEDIFNGRSPAELQRSDDSEAFADSMEEEGGEEAFNTLAPEGYAERHIEQVKGWQGKIAEFLNWMNGTDASLRTELSELDDQYEGVSKDSEKKIADIAKELGALKEILVEIPREIKLKTRDQAEVDAEAGIQQQPATY